METLVPLQLELNAQAKATQEAIQQFLTEHMRRDAEKRERALLEAFRRVGRGEWIVLVTEWDYGNREIGYRVVSMRPRGFWDWLRHKWWALRVWWALQWHEET